MATAARGASTKSKNQIMAQRMKDLRIIRTTARCPVCYKIVALPVDRHLSFGCK